MTRITLRSLAVISVMLLLSSCNKSTKIISEWDAGRDDIDKRERIAVVAMMPEALQRYSVEQEIVEVKRTGLPRSQISRIGTSNSRKIAIADAVRASGLSGPIITPSM